MSIERMKEGFEPPHMFNKPEFWTKEGPALPKGPKKVFKRLAPKPDRLRGYIADGRMLADVQKLLGHQASTSGAQRLASSEDELIAAVEFLAEPNRVAVLALRSLYSHSPMPELCFGMGLGYQLTEFPREELEENFDGQMWKVELAERSVELFDDGGLVHFFACPDGVRVWNSEWDWEDPITSSVDVFAWAVVHRSAALDGSYDQDAYAESLQKLGIVSRDLEL